MPRRRRASNIEHVFKRLSDDEKALVPLAGLDAKTLGFLDRAMEGYRAIESDVHTLGEDLRRIDEECARDENAFSSQRVKTELASAFFSIEKVLVFLRRRGISSNAIDRLKVAMHDLAIGHRPAMFQSVNPGGRHPDGPSIQQIKGVLAGLMHTKRRRGMSREQAANWIVIHVSPALASRISRKPITARMVKEWLDRYGGSSPPENAGGQAFTIWSRSSDRELTVERFRDMTERMAATFPAHADEPN